MVPKRPSSGIGSAHAQTAIRAIAKARIQCTMPALQQSLPSTNSCYAFVPEPQKGDFQVLANTRRACPLAKRAVRELVLRICSSTTKSMQILKRAVHELVTHLF